MPQAQPFLRQLAGDRRGNVLLLTAAIMFVMTALIGGAVDLSLVYRAQNRLQGACDAGVLAARRAVDNNGLDNTAQTQGAKYFNVNYVDSQQGTKNTTLTWSTPDNGVTVNATATTTVPLRIMSLFGRYTYNLTVTCGSTQSIGNVDIMFVLDNTGSMADTPTGFSQSKIVALKIALKNFQNTIKHAVQGTNARVRYGFVPYSSSVNVGNILYSTDPSWLVDSYAMQSRVARFETIVYGKFGSYTLKTSEQIYNSTPNSNASLYSSTAYSSQAACFAALPAESAWSNNGSSSTSTGNINTNGISAYGTTVSQPKVQSIYTCTRSGDSYYQYRFYAYMTQNTYTYSSSPSSTTTSTVFDHFDYMLVNRDVSAYKAFSAVSTNTGSSGAAESSTWDGCIEERSTVSDSSFAYSSGTNKITPSTALDLDIDTAPSSDATRWAPMWPEMAYYRGTNTSVLSTTGYKAQSFCPESAQLLSEMSQSDYELFVNNMNATGATYQDIGMLWAARMMSSTGMFSSNVTATPTNGGSVTRHVIFMTDGAQQASNGIQQAYGIEWNDRRITDDGYSSDDARHLSRFRAICDAIKGRGIRIWVIGYATSLTSDLTYCASPSSSFTANNDDQINSAFQEIAKQASALRVSS